MRIACDQPISQATSARSRVASPQTDGGFADTLTSALEATDADTHAPELSASTYRLFAAIDLERGDTEHAALHLSRVATAREAGLPRTPSGLVAGSGRWDYTEAAAALPDTGIFDTRTGQGVRSFTPYGGAADNPPSDGCEIAATDAESTRQADAPARERPRVATASANDTVDRLRNAVTALLDETPGDRRVV